jgi:hypothetical protein
MNALKHRIAMLGLANDRVCCSHSVEEAVMTVKIPLRLQGIDLRDVEAYDRIDPELTELSWEANGGVSLAVLYSDDPSAVAAGEAVDWARRIAKLMPGVSVAGAHDELVSISDIAVRVGVAAEAARLWASGKRRASLRPFPSPRQVVGNGSGGKTMNLYMWREVVSWVRDVIGTDPDDGIEYLTDAQLAHLNAQLVDITSADAWHPINIETEHVIAEVQQLCGAEISTNGTGKRSARTYDDAASAKRRLKLCVGS